MFDRIINYGITISTPFFSPILPCSFPCTTSHSLLRRRRRRLSAHDLLGIRKGIHIGFVV